MFAYFLNFITYRNSKAELSELSKYIDIIHKQQRLPLEEEMDWIMVCTILFCCSYHFSYC